MHAETLSEATALLSFLAFLDGRPDDERWELVSGARIMMTPPKFGHQRIASNLKRALNDRLEAVRPAWRAYREVGVLLDESNRFEPEIAVVDESIDPDTSHTHRFYGIVEVTSSTDRKRAESGSMIAEKVERYRRHSSNLFVVVVDQERAHVAVHERRLDGSWEIVTFEDLDDTLTIPPLGAICMLRVLYKGAKPAFETKSAHRPK